MQVTEVRLKKSDSTGTDARLKRRFPKRSQLGSDETDCPAKVFGTTDANLGRRDGVWRTAALE